MIDLTPLEVRQKKDDFRRSFRGYDVELVDDFLDLVADRMEELVGQNMKLSDRVEALDRELSAYRKKETALSDALMTAQRLQEDAREHAAREAELMMREARLSAEAVRQDAERALVREEETLRQVRARRAQLVHSFRSLLERELSELEVIEDTLQLGEGQEEQLRLLSGGAGPGAEGEPAGEEAEGEVVGEEGLDIGTGREAAAAVDEWEEEWNSAVGPETGDVAREGGEEGEPGGQKRAEAGRADGAQTQGRPREAEDHDLEDDDWLSSLREGFERD